MTRRKSTAIGFLAVLLWALLAALTVGSSPVPPLQLNAMCFAIGATIGGIWLWRTGGLSVLGDVRWTVYAFGTAGLFGYHALYFSALRLAPPAQAGLIAYLWPLLIVLFSGLLPGERLRSGHVIGAIISFIGAALVLRAGDQSIDSSAALGLGLAFLCAITWAGYSVLSRRLGAVPTQSVAVFCLATAILSVPLHLAFETTVWPDSTLGWASIALLGIGPVGLAFFTWDIGVKRGDIQLLGVASYAAPILSTGVLIGLGLATASSGLILAAVLVTVGAALAAQASARNS